jgi:glutamate dehydrogenase (NADP+)
VVTLSDSAGYIYDADGIDATKLAFVMELKNVKRGRIEEYTKQYPNAKFVAGKRPWEVKVDIALPCATQNELNGEEAAALIANGVMCVAEGANMPSTPEAIINCHTAKVLFAPGKASNAGGVATSGLEMSQNSLRLSWTAEEVDSRLHGIMVSIHEACVKYGKQADGSIDYVKGANIAGFVKVADAMIDQGLV